MGIVSSYHRRWFAYFTTWPLLRTGVGIALEAQSDNLSGGKSSCPAGEFIWFLEAHNSEPRLVNKAGWVAAYCLGTRLSSQGLYYVADNLVPKAVLRERLGMEAALPFSQVPFTTSNPRTLTLCCKKACGKEAGSLQVSER